MAKNTFIFTSIIFKDNLLTANYGIYFPDFAYLVDSASTFEEAVDKAERKLKYELYRRLTYNEDIPNPIPLNQLERHVHDKIVLIKVDIEELQDHLKQKKVPVYIRIPGWLNRQALEQQINFSEFLSHALHAHLLQATVQEVTR